MTEHKDGAAEGVVSGSSQMTALKPDSQDSPTAILSGLKPETQAYFHSPAVDQADAVPGTAAGYDESYQVQQDMVDAPHRMVHDQDSLERRLEEADARIAELENENRFLTDEYVEADKVLRESESRIGQVQNALVERDSDHDALAADYRDVISTSLRFRNRLEQGDKTITELSDQVIKLKVEVDQERQARYAIEERADKAEFKVALNQEVDDVKELYGRESLEIRVKSMMREVAIPTFNVDFVAAAFMDARYNHPDIVCERYELLPEFFMKEFLEKKEGFLDHIKDDNDMFNWFLTSAFGEAFDRAMTTLAMSAYDDVQKEYKRNNPDADSGVPVSGSPEVENLRAELSAELNGFNSLQELVLSGLSKYILSSIEYVNMPLDVKDRGLIGVLIAGRKKDLPKSLSYGTGIEKGASIRESFMRDKPIDTDAMKEYWDVFCEQIDDMAAAYKDERAKDSLARYLEEKFGKNPFTSATIEGTAETLDEMGISDIFIIFYDEDKKLRQNIRRQRAGPNAGLIDKLDLGRLMSDDPAVIKAEIESKWNDEYFSVPVTSGDDLVGRVFALKDGTCFNQFEKSTLSVLASNLGRNITQHYKKLREYRVALSKKVALRMIDEGRDLETTVRGHMSVLYADVCGFTSASEIIDPADMTSILNLFFEQAREITDSLDITHDKTMGDCTMELVGPPYLEAPVDVDFVNGDPVEYASRGVECLLRFRDGLEELNERYFQNPDYVKEYGEATQEYLRDNPVRISMGIASGIADFCRLGASVSPDISAVGPVVNLGARVQGVAEAGQIVVCPETFLLLTTGKTAEFRSEEERIIPSYISEEILSFDGKYLFRPVSLDPISLKGVDKPQRLYEVNKKKK